MGAGKEGRNGRGKGRKKKKGERKEEGQSFRRDLNVRGFISEIRRETLKRVHVHEGGSSEELSRPHFGPLAASLPFPERNKTVWYSVRETKSIDNVN